MEGEAPGTSSNRMNGRPVLVLLSGGVDSAACVAFFQSQHYKVSALFVDYGQAALRQELLASKRIAKCAGISLVRIKISGLGLFGAGYIPARNALLLTTALSYWNRKTGMIALGIHAGTSYSDCSPGFVDAMQRMFDVYADGRIRLTCPFLAWNKTMIWAFCREVGVPLDITYSCERGNKRPCGRCLSCKDRRALGEFRK